MLLIWNNALVAALAGTGGLVSGLPANGAVLDISDVMQFFEHDKSSCISQLIYGKWRDLQKLLKYSNETTTSVSNMLLPTGVHPIIFVLSSTDLLLVVLLLFII